MGRVRAITKVLEFYEALGFDRLPLEMPNVGFGSFEEKGEALERLRHQIGDCTRCRLSKGRTNVVFGDGNADAELMFVGEGPGRDEDARGLPFVGEAGKLLDRLIARMEFHREEVYIANMVKCRPPGNRDPEDDELATCRPFIEEQIRIIQPRVIVTLGRVAAHALLGTNIPISRMRGHFAEYEGIDVMPTFHPAYLLRQGKAMVPDMKLVWSDACQVLARLGRKVPE
jgi:DNA polymerase